MSFAPFSSPEGYIKIESDQNMKKLQDENLNKALNLLDKAISNFQSAITTANATEAKKNYKEIKSIIQKRFAFEEAVYSRISNLMDKYIIIPKQQSTLVREFVPKLQEVKNNHLLKFKIFELHKGSPEEVSKVEKENIKNSNNEFRILECIDSKQSEIPYNKATIAIRRRKTKIAACMGAGFGTVIALIGAAFPPIAIVGGVILLATLIGTLISRYKTNKLEEFNRKEFINDMDALVRYKHNLAENSVMLKAFNDNPNVNSKLQKLDEMKDHSSSEYINTVTALAKSFTYFEQLKNLEKTPDGDEVIGPDGAIITAKQARAQFQHLFNELV